MLNTWDDNLILYIEVSSMCNALCPQCDRYKPGTLEVHEHVPNAYWSLEQFKQAFTPQNLQLAKVVNFAGLYGDPVTNPHLYDMVKYVLKNCDAKVIIETNGSLKTTAWWTKLGELGIRVQFDVDGSTQEIHSRYRMNTNLNKILNNMEAFSSAGGYTKVMTILFKHNENELEAIKELTKEYGAQHWDSTQSLRFFGKTDKYNFKDLKGNEHTLETPTNDKLAEAPLRRIRNFEERVQPTVCPSSEYNFLQIDSHGNVWPCCDLLEANDRKLEDVGYTDKINLFKYSLKEVLDSDWYKQFSPKFKQCSIWCSHSKQS